MKHSILVMLCVACAGMTCVGAAESAPKLKVLLPELLHKFEITKSVSGAPRAANSTGTMSAKEAYVNFVTSDSVSFGEDYAAAAVLKGTLALTNSNGSKVNENTLFTLTAGDYSTEFAVGDDPNYTGKETKAAQEAFVVMLDFGGKTKNIKQTLVLNWKADSLKFSITTAGDNDTGDGPVFAALKKAVSTGELKPKPVAVPVTVPVTISFGPDSASFSISGSGKVIATDVNEGLPNGGSHLVHTVDYTASAK